MFFQARDSWTGLSVLYLTPRYVAFDMIEAPLVVNVTPKARSFSQRLRSCRNQKFQHGMNEPVPRCLTSASEEVNVPYSTGENVASPRSMAISSSASIKLVV
jgi:hypothetical protein